MGLVGLVLLLLRQEPVRELRRESPTGEMGSVLSPHPTPTVPQCQRMPLCSNLGSTVIQDWLRCRVAAGLREASSRCCSSFDSNSGFLSLRTINILSLIILFCGSCPVCWRRFSSIPGLNSLDASSTRPPQSR